MSWQTNAQTEDISYTYNDFYQNLAPYGQWIKDPKFGYVWSPNVDGGFRPYFTNGHWAMTQYGNTWVSDYLWGWACFHYGRWTFDNYYGWLWIPGSVWGPAWVMWRSGVGYMGWAPLSPSYAFKDKTSPEKYVCPKDWWVFLPPRYLYSGNYYSYWSGPTGNATMLKQVAQLGNFYDFNGNTFIFGPYAKQVEKITKNPVQQFHLGTSLNLTTKVHLDEIKIFRPAEIKPVTENADKVIPPNLVATSHPVTENPQSINSEQGKLIPPFKTEHPSHFVPTTINNATTAAKAKVDKSKIAPQAPDEVPYTWENKEYVQQADTIEYKIAPVLHPDNGPVQHPDPLPKAKDPNPKKLPSQSSQNLDPVRADDHKVRK